MTVRTPALVAEPPAVDDTTTDIAIDGLRLGVITAVAGGKGRVPGALALSKSGVLERIVAAVTSGYVEESMTPGVPMLSLTVEDDERAIARTDVFEYSVEATLDDIAFHLVRVQYNDDRSLTLSFEHHVVSDMRQFRKPMKVSRGAMTRAQFIYKMVREIPSTVRFISPDLGVKQRLAVPVDDAQSVKRRKTVGKGFEAGASVTIKGKSANAEQRRNLEISLGVAARLKASPKATLAMVCAGIGESSFTVVPNAQGSVYGGVFQGKYRADSYGPAQFSIGDTEGMATCFLKGGKGFQGGGAIYLARKHPGMRAGEISITVEGAWSNFSSREAAINFYDQHREEAAKIIAAYQGGGASFGGGDTYWSRYEFSRGQPGVKHEDSWGAGQRLAAEVRWRLFVVGRNLIYYVNDDDLIGGLPRYIVTPQTDGFVRLSADLEVGGRYVVANGKKDLRPSEATLTVRADRWAARPGTALVLSSEFGASLAGQWLVDHTHRDLFDAEMEVSLRKPQAKLPEPRSQLRTRKDASGTGAVGGASTDAILDPKGADAVDKVYNAGVAIDARNLPYGPGGHGLQWAAAAKATSMDCSSSSSMALHAGGFIPSPVQGPVVSSWFLTWGKPGRGREFTVWVKPGLGGDGHVFIEFYGRRFKRFDTVPNGSGGRGPHMRTTGPTYISSAYVPRHWPVKTDNQPDGVSGPKRPVVL